MEITEEILNDVREKLKNRLGEKRFLHTLGVEREAGKLAELFLPEKSNKMRLAALLHDITKEYKVSEHTSLCDKYGIEVPDEYLRNPKLFHSLTGAYLVKDEFAELADEEIFNSVLYHTVGRRNMTQAEKIIYLADYIEDTRTFDDCKKLRKFFWDGISLAKTEKEKLGVLNDTMILSFDMTINNLICENCEINLNTIEARNYFLEQRNNCI